MAVKSPWTYWTETRLDCAELASWYGDRAPETRVHFHDEDQITLVLSGSRAFSIAGNELQVSEGNCLAIPAGIPHRNLPRFVADTRCVNLYLDTALTFGVPLTFPVSDYMDFCNEIDPAYLREQILAQIERRSFVVTEHTIMTSKRLWVGRGPIARIAEAHGLSREAYSRTFRREVGMPPHSFRLMVRLNAARRRLRSGHDIASVAAEFGFADQSHMGRHFRSVFGVTPGAYVEGVRQSQTFQT